MPKVVVDFGNATEIISAIQNMTELIGKMASEIQKVKKSWTNKEIKDKIGYIKDVQGDVAFICAKILAESDAAKIAGKKLIMTPIELAEIGKSLRDFAEAGKDFIELDVMRKFQRSHFDVVKGILEKDFYIINHIPESDLQSIDNFVVFINNVYGYIKKINEELDKVIKDLA